MVGILADEFGIETELAARCQVVQALAQFLGLGDNLFDRLCHTFPERGEES